MRSLVGRQISALGLPPSAELDFDSSNDGHDGARIGYRLLQTSTYKASKAKSWSFWNHGGLR